MAVTERQSWARSNSVFSTAMLLMHAGGSSVFVLLKHLRGSCTKPLWEMAQMRVCLGVDKCIQGGGRTTRPHLLNLFH